MFHLLKKTCGWISVFALTGSVAFANTAPYVGAGLGVTSNTATSRALGSFRGVPASILLGYGGVLCDTFFIAGELTGVLVTGEIADQGAVKTTYGYGVSLLPGVQLSEYTAAFLRAGFVRSHFSDVNTNKNGGQVGFGLQTALTQHIDLRGEYDFNDYGTIHSGAYSGRPRIDVATASLIYKF